MKLLHVARLFVSLIVFALTPVWPASAQTTPVTDWKVMTPDNCRYVNPVDQCKAAANVYPTDELEPRHCDEFGRKLDAKQCGLRTVGDGIVHEFLSTCSANEVSILRNKRKVLGRTDLAHVCPVSNNIDIYYYTEQPGVSCYNIGTKFGVRRQTAPPPPVTCPTGYRKDEANRCVRIIAPPPIPQPAPKPAQYFEEKICEPDVTVQTGSSGVTWSTPGTVIDGGCCNCGKTQFVPGQSTTYSGTSGSYTIPGACRVVTRRIIQ